MLGYRGKQQTTVFFATKSMAVLPHYTSSLTNNTAVTVMGCCMFGKQLTAADTEASL
jgi:hypothetical protein